MRLEIYIHWNVACRIITNNWNSEITIFCSRKSCAPVATSVKISSIPSQDLIRVSSKHFRPTLHNSNVFSRLEAQLSLELLLLIKLTHQYPFLENFEEGVGVIKPILLDLASNNAKTWWWAPQSCDWLSRGVLVVTWWIDTRISILTI